MVPVWRVQRWAAPLHCLLPMSFLPPSADNPPEIEAVNARGQSVAHLAAHAMDMQDVQSYRREGEEQEWERQGERQRERSPSLQPDSWGWQVGCGWLVAGGQGWGRRAGQGRAGQSAACAASACVGVHACRRMCGCAGVELTGLHVMCTLILCTLLALLRAAAPAERAEHGPVGGRPLGRVSAVVIHTLVCCLAISGEAESVSSQGAVEIQRVFSPSLLCRPSRAELQHLATA